ncbi:MAG: hypothetical protein V7739_18850 [Motiliproteus sp.]
MRSSSLRKIDVKNGIVYIDMDDTLCDFKGTVKQRREANKAVGFPQCQYGFFTALKPLEGAIEAVNWFCKSEHFGLEFCDRLILCAHKNLLRGNYLIDDSDHGKGQDKFT